VQSKALRFVCVVLLLLMARLRATGVTLLLAHSLPPRNLCADCEITRLC
jgi:hypothetical protein